MYYSQNTNYIATLTFEAIAMVLRKYAKIVADILHNRVFSCDFQPYWLTETK